MTKSGETAQWVLTLVNTFTNVGELIEKMGIVHDKLPDWLKDRLKQTLAGDTKEAKKSVRDEILYGTAVYALNATESAEITAFEAELREKDAPKAEAFVLFVAKGLDEFKRENKKFPRYKKGDTGTGTEIGWITYGEGLEQAKKFLRDLLSRRGATPQKTLEKRIAFLKGKNVFSLIPPEKVTPPIVDKATEKAMEVGREIAKEQEPNLKRLEATMSTFRERAKKYRESKGR